MPLMDAWLVYRARAGDSRAFGTLYDRHASRVYNLLRRLTGGEITATEDLTQETFLAAYRSLQNWKGHGAVSTWLCGIAVRQYRQHYRRTRDDEPLDDTLPDTDDATDPLARYQHKQVVEALEAAITALPALYREAFTLTYVEGFAYKEVAQLLDIPVGTVQSRLNKAKALLRHHLRPLLTDDESAVSTASEKANSHVF